MSKATIYKYLRDHSVDIKFLKSNKSKTNFSPCKGAHYFMTDCTNPFSPYSKTVSDTGVY